MERRPEVRELTYVIATDARRAYFHSPAKRDLYIVLPSEYVHGDRRTQLGHSHVSLYGTRDAACNWQGALAEHLHTLDSYVALGTPVSLCIPIVRFGLWSITYLQAIDWTSVGWMPDWQSATRSSRS